MDDNNFIAKEHVDTLMEFCKNILFEEKNSKLLVGMV
jgi:hypothetical protein